MQGFNQAMRSLPTVAVTQAVKSSVEVFQLLENFTFYVKMLLNHQESYRKGEASNSIAGLCSSPISFLDVSSISYIKSDLQCILSHITTISYTARYTFWQEWSLINLAAPAIQPGSKSWSAGAKHSHFISATKTIKKFKETRAHTKARDAQQVGAVKELRPIMLFPSSVVEKWVLSGISCWHCDW